MQSHRRAVDRAIASTEYCKGRGREGGKVTGRAEVEAGRGGREGHFSSLRDVSDGRDANASMSSSVIPSMTSVLSLSSWRSLLHVSGQRGSRVALPPDGPDAPEPQTPSRGSLHHALRAQGLAGLRGPASAHEARGRLDALVD